MDLVTTMNLVLSVVIVALAIVAYISKKSRIAMYIGVGFALFGVSHFMTLIGLATSLADVLLVVRTLGYSNHLCTVRDLETIDATPARNPINLVASSQHRQNQNATPAMAS